MDNQACKKCGAKLLEGQNFCSRCGTQVVTKPACSRCGAELADGYVFCPQCGKKVELDIGKRLSSTTDPLSEGARMKKKSMILILAIVIPVVLIAVELLVFSLLSEPLKGKYTLVGSISLYDPLYEDNDVYYIFEDGFVTYNFWGDTIQGKYKVVMNHVILTYGGDYAGYGETLYRKGKYLFTKERHFDEKLQNGKTVDQTLTLTDVFHSSLGEGKMVHELKLSSDGTCTYTMHEKRDGISDDFCYEFSGVYKRSGNMLILSLNDMRRITLIINNGIVYTGVYLKEK